MFARTSLLQSGQLLLGFGIGSVLGTAAFFYRHNDPVYINDANIRLRWSSTEVLRSCRLLFFDFIRGSNE